MWNPESISPFKHRERFSFEPNRDERTQENTHSLTLTHNNSFPCEHRPRPSETRRVSLVLRKPGEKERKILGILIGFSSSHFAYLVHLLRMLCLRYSPATITRRLDSVEIPKNPRSIVVTCLCLRLQNIFFLWKEKVMKAGILATRRIQAFCCFQMISQQPNCALHSVWK